MNYNTANSSEEFFVFVVGQDFEDEASDEDGNDKSDGDGDVQAGGHVPSFLTINQIMENE